MDRIEMFGHIAHNLAANAEGALSIVQEMTETPLETLVDLSALCLNEMDKYLFSKDDSDDAFLKYMNDTAKLAQAGMLGHQYTLGNGIHCTRLANQMVDTYKRKNADYGDSFGASLDKYGPVAAHVRMSDKINRLQSLVVRKQTAQVKDESIADTFLDLACYAIMRLLYIEMKSAEIEEEKEDAEE